MSPEYFMQLFTVLRSVRDKDKGVNNEGVFWNDGASLEVRKARKDNYLLLFLCLKQDITSNLRAILWDCNQ